MHSRMAIKIFIVGMPLCLGDLYNWTGSGSNVKTTVAAGRLNRRWYGMNSDAGYAAMAKARVCGA